VGGGVGQVQKERLARRFLLVLPQEAHRVIADRIRIIKDRGLVIGVVFGGDKPVLPAQGGRVEEIAIPADGAIELLKTALQGPVGVVVVGAVAVRDVPFAAHIRAVAGGAQYFRDRHALAIQVAAVTRVIAVHHHVADARLVRIQAGQQRRPRGAAARGVVELGEPEAVGRQRIQVRRLNLPAATAQVGKADVVGQDQQKIGPLRPPQGQEAQQQNDRPGRALHKEAPGYQVCFRASARRNPARARRRCMARCASRAYSAGTAGMSASATLPDLTADACTHFTRSGA